MINGRGICWLHHAALFAKRRSIGEGGGGGVQGRCSDGVAAVRGMGWDGTRPGRTTMPSNVPCDFSDARCLDRAAVELNGPQTPRQSAREVFELLLLAGWVAHDVSGSLHAWLWSTPYAYLREPRLPTPVHLCPPAPRSLSHE